MASLAVSLFASPASAQTHGTFQTSYSGGSVTAKVLSGSGGSATCSNTPQITPFNPGGYPPYSGSANVSAGTDSGGGTNQCSAQIVNSPLTAAFAWTPDPRNPSEPAPTSGILTQTCDASWSFGKDSTSTASGTGPSNGLSNGVVTPPGSDPNNQSATSSSTLYSAWSGSSVSNSPSAGFSGTSGPGYSHAGLSGSVSATYSASVTPIFINLGGTYNPSAGDNRVLTGQQITATLIGIPTNFTVTKYTWAGVSGTCFKDYDFTLPSNQLSPLGPTDLSGPAVSSLAFYDSVAESLTLTCTVTVQAPDGTSLSLIASSPKVDVKKPTVTKWGIAEGYVQSNAKDQGYGLYPNPATSNPQGMTWHDVAVTVPAPFSGGRCDFAQLVEPDREEYKGSTSNPINNDPKNGLLGLDGNFPYSLGGYGSGWNPPATGGNSDSPHLIANGNPNNDTQLSANDTFTTWVIYRPPSQSGNNTVWVPLQKYSWTWSVQLTWSSSQWNIAAAFPAIAGAGPSYTPQDATDPPQWNLVH